MDNNVISYYLFEHLLFTLALIAHFLGDFHFQSQALANEKKVSFKALLIHLFWVGLPLLMIAIIFPFRIDSFFFEVWLAHFAIDFIPNFKLKLATHKKFTRRLVVQAFFRVVVHPIFDKSYFFQSRFLGSFW